MDGETTATFSVRVDGGLGYEVKAAWLVNDTQTDVQQLISAVQNTGAAGSFRFTAPKNTTSLPQTYVIEVSAKDNPSVKDILKVTVPVPATETPAPAAPSADDKYYEDYNEDEHDNWGTDDSENTQEQTVSESTPDSTSDSSQPSAENVFSGQTSDDRQAP